MSKPDVSALCTSLLILIIALLTGCTPDYLNTKAVSLDFFEQVALKKEIASLKAQLEAGNAVLMAGAEESSEESGDSEEKSEEDEKEVSQEKESEEITKRIQFLVDSLEIIEKSLKIDTNPAGAIPVPPICQTSPGCPSPCAETKDCDVFTPGWKGILVNEVPGVDVEVILTTLDGKILSAIQPGGEGYRKLGSTGYALIQMPGAAEFEGMTNLSVTKTMGEQLLNKYSLKVEIGAAVHDESHP
ncbi:MAG: hypothetical protein AAFV07_03320 [Bacteroidota bacterium]